MKALILVGGFGTRLRPLTFTMPKPCVEFINKPVLCHQLEALAKAGVTEVILAINYQPETMRDRLDLYSQQYNIKIICSVEEEPLGTAGPLALARNIILADNYQGGIFVLNADIITDYPFVQMLEFHQRHGREGTILTYGVEDPTKYGVIVSDESGEIQQFVEKPKEYIGNQINAGIYLLNTSALDRIQLRPTSIEREIFPEMAKDRQLFSFPLQSFWMDIGQPQDYLKGVDLYLNHAQQHYPEQLSVGDNITGSVIIHESATIGEGCLLGPNVVIGPKCNILAGTRIKNSVIFEGTKIGSHCWINGSIIGWRSRLGNWVRVEGLSVLGEDIQVAHEVCINAAIILPHKEMKVSQLEPGKVIL